jgi:hypothetical protein
VLKEEEKFDTILTSETIYEQASHLKLFHLFKKIVRKGGKALIAAKSYYFGCSGTLGQFMDLIKGDSDVKGMRVVFMNSDSVRREILELQF